MSFGSLNKEDRQVLFLLTPLFALITAATVAALTFARALFLEHRPHSDLPWMFIVAAFFTAVCTFTYLPLMKRWALTLRFQALVGSAILSFIVLGVLAVDEPVATAPLLFAWFSGISQLLVMQMWSYSISLLPIRRARHLFPLLAAAATTGAMLGGAAAAIVPAQFLVYLSAALLSLVLFFVRRSSRDLAEAHLGPDTKAGAPVRRSSGSTGGIRGSWSVLTSTPLLKRLALLAVAIQVGSLLLDVQLSAAAKSNFDADTLATFFGLYFAAANGLTLGLSLLGAERLANRIGLGWVAALPAWPLLLGSLALAIFSILESSAAAMLGVVIVTSLGERVVTFGAARHAFGAAMTPVDARDAERARFVIDGILVRGATIIASFAVMMVGVDLTSWWSLTPAVLVAAAIAIAVVPRVQSAYRKALIAGLQSDQVGTIDAQAVRRWAQREAVEGLRELLTSKTDTDVGEGLRRCVMLELPPPQDLIESLLGDSRPGIQTQTLRTLAQLGQTVPTDLLLPSLDPNGPARRLRAALLVASHAHNEADAHWGEALRNAVAALRDHQDPLVRSLASALHGDPPERYSDSFKKVLDSVLFGGMRATRRTAFDAALTVAALESNALVAPLLDALRSARLAPAATVALHRLSPVAVAAELKPRLSDDSRSLTERTRLIHLAEQLLASDAISPALRQSDTALRNRAVEALWRLNRRGVELHMPPEEVVDLTALEIDALLRCAQIDLVLAQDLDDSRIEFLRGQLAMRRNDNEQRVFRLLTLIYRRSTIDRAFNNYRSAFERSRSNAIELLDATIADDKLRRLIPYIEATQHADGRAYSKPQASLDRSLDVGTDLGHIDPLLERIHGWADETSHDNASAPPRDPGFNTLMDRVLLLSRISLFANTPAEELLLVAEVCQPVTYAAGDVIFRPGDPAEKLYLLERGRVEILRDKRRVAMFEERQAFGELAILGDAARNTTARAVTDVDCLVLARIDFSALLDVSPSLAKGAIAVLGERLRQTLERLG